MSRGRLYCRSGLKRALDVAFSFTGLLVLSPLFLVLYVAIVVSMGPPALFVQERVGLDGRPFRLIKFRSMRRAISGLLLTGTGDPRITPLGRFLRGSKLDELPQLWNVLRGEMSLVGPRPEVPRYVSHYTPEQRRILDARPGLTDPATVQFRNEETLIGAVPAEQRESFYLETVLPTKLRLNQQYLERASPAYDISLIAQTLLAIVRPARS